MRLLIILLSLLSLHGTFVLGEEYNFEFGVNKGEIIFTKDDNIGPVSHSSKIQITAPEGMKITYVKVTVTALAPPKVDYNEDLHEVNIKFSLLELPMSSYRIVAKGVKRIHQHK